MRAGGVDYPAAMPASAAPAKPRGLALVLQWSRVRFTLLFALALGFLLGLGWTSGMASVMVRTVALGLIGLVVFGVLEQWPRRLPRRLARWALQVLGVAVAMPVSTFAIYVLSTDAGAPPFWQVPDRLEGFATLTVLGVLLAPWVALAALVRQKDALARHQALAFELERSELERQALDARLHLLQAQMTPHFLFNTLANVQALVESNSPQAAPLLRSLIAYLRAAVPRLNAGAGTLEQEVHLVRAYLELMHMRMPDRLQYALDVDPTALRLHCPPMTLLTLVENAVRHGIDPSEDGGRIELQVERRGERLHIRVADTGVGLRASDPGRGLGTGLATLRERLALAFGGEVPLRVSGNAPRGVCVELELPGREPAA
ncbi:hypothetical protein GCM10007167_21190 [Vulcaniibacterium thermophilum]|uniref:Histidine kinase domain-containing protein n=2 Tax=Vulcaniibacterium thermophilum TaxID=1169913 RepID=A0A918Z775_9GAMM|nr:hypothetical protein GCM10007167_21190 [Vulcaniibacterium thermophilum]